MTSPIKAIIFDFGNVLLEWNPRNVYQRYFPDDPESMEHFLEEVDFMNWNAQQDKGRTFAEGVALLSEQFPHHAELIQAYHDNWKDSIGTAYTGTVKLLKELKQAGYPVYGLSNWSAETFPYARQKYAFFELLDDIVISGHVGHIKPDPEIFHILLEKIGHPAQECLFIDDALPNIDQARKMGFQTIHFESSDQLEARLRELHILT